MALITVEIIKKSVRKVQDGQWSVTWTLKGLDETITEIPEFEQDFNEDYKEGDEISRVETGFVKQIQNYIDQYQQEQVLLNALVHDTAVATVQALWEV